MGVSVLGSSFSSGLSCPAPGASAPVAGDLMVLLTTTSVTTPSVPSAVTGCGATWTLVHTSARTTVWIGTDPTSQTAIVASSTTTSRTAAWWLRDAAPILATASWATSASSGGTVASTPATVGPTQAILALAHSQSGGMPGVGALPSPGAWSATSGSGITRAHAAPAVTSATYMTEAFGSGQRTTLVVAVIGTPPPDAPTALILTPAEDTIDVSWTAPTGPGVPVGYTVALDGAAPVDVGNVTSWLLGPLTPSTSYTVDVHAYNAAGTSPALSGVATTLDPPPPPAPGGGYVAHLRVGDHSWDVTSADPADFGPIAALRCGWTAPENDGWPTQPSPSLLTFGVVVPQGTDFDDVDQGTWVHFTFTPDGYTTPLLEFGGDVRDLVARPVAQGMLYSMVAVDPLKRLDEDYVTSVFLPEGFAMLDVWDEMVQDGGGSLGTEPALPDPLVGQDRPGSGGFVGPSEAGGITVQSSTWAALTGFARAQPFRLGADPVRQRVILGYNLDAAGDLDAAAPFSGTYMAQGSAELVTAPVPANMVPTDGAEWSRPRIEPNVVTSDGYVMAERAHTGPDIVLAQSSSDGFVFTDPYWVIDGVEGPSQWSTALEVEAWKGPSVVAGWFDLPTALNTYVQVSGVDPRHTPDGSGVYEGLLASAALTIRAGRAWSVGFALRRTLPAP